SFVLEGIGTGRAWLYVGREGDLVRGCVVHVELHALSPPRSAEEEAAVVDDEAARVLGRIHGADLAGGGVVHEQLGDEGIGYAAGALLRSSRDRSLRPA